MTQVHVLKPIKHECIAEYNRADLEFYGVDHFRPSFTVLVFFNDPDVNEENADSGRSTFAGEFSVFGHPICVGDDGHCHAPSTLRRFDLRPSHPLTKAFVRLVVTSALLLIPPDEELTITLVSHCESTEFHRYLEHTHHPPSRLFEFDAVQLTTFGS